MAYQNLPKLPERKKVERLIDCEATIYSYDEILETAKMADNANSRWEQVTNKAWKFATAETSYFLMSEKEHARRQQIVELSNKYCEVTIFGARRHSTEAYPLATAQKAIRKLEVGIKKMEVLAYELESTFGEL